ncbi:subtilase family protein [Forsythia ovata]|uniref:Subtilase family protein n=1 Tax=Forsythia ovata TaxID=205694 RepID=A0ABD1S1P2_9LAMI
MKAPSSSFLLVLIILHLSVSCAKRQIYIVYMGEHEERRNLLEIEDKHLSYLMTVKNSREEAKASMVYSYKNVINGFSAFLTAEEARKLSEMDRVVSVFKSHPMKYMIQTTRSWDFINLLTSGNSGNISGIKDEEILQKADYGKDIIVGVLDTGVWPESQSFSDEGMGPVPSSWKGICQSGIDFNSSHCNRKLIGARYYLKGYEAQYGPLNETINYRSARDRDGHGTHTASTVAGRKVHNTSLLGRFASGTAEGGAPLARLAIYKVCWTTPAPSKVLKSTCFHEDMMAAFDDAIADGVHVISISISPYKNIEYTQDGIALGALHATKRNIVVVASAGNWGPAPSTVRNVVPWIITVGASSIDRIFSSPVLLGNGLKIEGQTVTPYKLNTVRPLVYAGDAEAPGTTTNDTVGLCLSGTLSQEIVQGKIVLCLRGNSSNVEKGMEVKRAGGAGFILQNPADGIGVSVDAHVLPGTAIFSNDSATILNYIRTNKNPTARIVPGRTVLGSKPSPFMTSFSSTGPNGLEPNILKPDITAPGLNILAAWSEATSPTKLFADNRVVKYNVLSGTSMSCPHVAAAAALIKAAHPDWSSAAIRSALMTTSTQSNNIGTPITDANGNPATPFHYGSGHFQPAKAMDPGLVYDSNYTDYLLFLCSYNNTAKNVDPSFTCPREFLSPSNLNYPTVAASFINGEISVHRTVTNVGAGGSVYKLSIGTPIGYSVNISPTTLNFKHSGEMKSFNITIKPEIGVTIDDYAFGWYMWSDGTHTVRSPIVVL